MVQKITFQGNYFTGNCLLAYNITCIRNFIYFLFFFGICPLQNTEEGSRTIVYAAIAPRVEGKGGSYLSNCVRVPVNSLAKDRNFLEKFFSFTCNLLDIKTFGEY